MKSQETTDAGWKSKIPQFVTFAAFVIFGISSWVMTDVTYLELNAFLQELPEEYSINAYAIFALESTNIYPILYVLLNSNQKYVRQTTVIWVILSLGILVAALMSGLWDQTAVIFGEEHSVPMLVLTHFGGVVSTLSSVVFYPYVSQYPSIYTSALGTGEGLSGAVSGFLAVIQQPFSQDDMVFSVSLFYIISACILSASLSAFAFLQLHPYPRLVQSGGHDSGKSTENPTVADDSSADDIENGNAPPLFTLAYDRAEEEETPSADESTLLISHEAKKSQKDKTEEEQGKVTTPVSKTKLFRGAWWLLSCQLAIAALEFGVLPSVMPYVYKKFAPGDNTEESTATIQTVASVTGFVFDPIFRLSTTRFRYYHVGRMTLIFACIATLLLCLSLTPHPILSNYHYGFILPLVCHVTYMVGAAYTNTMIFLTLKHTKEAHEDQRNAHFLYQWNGLATQIGGLVGTCIIFPLVYFQEDLFQ